MKKQQFFKFFHLLAHFLQTLDPCNFVSFYRILLKLGMLISLIVIYFFTFNFIINYQMQKSYSRKIKFLAFFSLLRGRNPPNATWILSQPSNFINGRHQPFKKYRCQIPPWGGFDPYIFWKLDVSHLWNCPAGKKFRLHWGGYAPLKVKKMPKNRFFLNNFFAFDDW